MAQLALQLELAPLTLANVQMDIPEILAKPV
jgi:hypothetical protein